MIKVRAGQVWNNIDTGRDLHINSDSIEYCDDINTNSYFTFIPQNDLEWLAVHVISWNGDRWTSIIDSFLRRINADDWSFTSEGYTKQQWKNMRYHLGLDKKPHYRLTGGEWVKQC